MNRGKRSRAAASWDLLWGDLARYNSERSHGLVHTEEYQQKMAKQQAEYAIWLREHNPDVRFVGADVEEER